MQINEILILENQEMEPKDENKFKEFTTNIWLLNSFNNKWLLCSEVSIGTNNKTFQKIPMSESSNVQCHISFYIKAALS